MKKSLILLLFLYVIQSVSAQYRTNKLPVQDSDLTIKHECVPGDSSPNSKINETQKLNHSRITAEDQTGAGIENWNYYVNYNPSFSNPNCQTQGISANASAPFCSCLSPGNTQNIVLKSTIDPLNGVNTFDLILISRHILGLAPLTTFNLIAADANMSNTITTFDIVELRKLILGSYPSLPNANSWRYFDKKAINTLLCQIQQTHLEH